MPTRSIPAALLVLALAACHEPEPLPHERLEPRRPVPAGAAGEEFRPIEPPVEAKVGDRDPEIDRALEVIRTSKRRFLAPDEDANVAPDEYTAEQFASMLETKREWVGYDITTFDLWLEEIATSSFMGRVAYLVVLEDGTTRELRGWLVERLKGG